MSLKICPRCDARFRGDIAICPIDGAALRAPTDPFVGRTIAGRYLIEEELGSGGMGTVYRARHQIIGRDVALKFLEPTLIKNERQRKRFLGEARAANQINHEHIIDITDFGETEDGMVYMVMEYLEGRTLSEEIEKGPMIPRRALRIATQVALGLARAHELGVVHRDIKPANIYLVRRKMDSDYVKILDFGVARIEHDVRITGQGTIVGTPEYIAPEQIRFATASPSADQYSLGCVLFEMLTTRLPFQGKTTMLLVKHLNDQPPAPSSLVGDIPPEVDELVLRLLKKEPRERFRDAYHLVEELQNLLDRLPPLTRTIPSEGSAPNVLIEASAPAPDPEEGFDHAIQVYHSFLAEAHPSGDAPAWLPQTIAQLEATVVEVRSLRQRLRGAAEKATALEEDSRAPRTQIGRALDELAQDDSRLNRLIDALNGQLAEAEAQLDAATLGAIDVTQALPVARWSAGQVFSQADALLVAQTRDAGSRLSAARLRSHGLRQELEQKRMEHKDLRFQIAELKDQLTTLNAVSTIDQQFTHDEVNRVSAQIQAKLEAVAPFTARIATHFNQFPQFRDRLGTGTGPVPMPVAAPKKASRTADGM